MLYAVLGDIHANWHALTTVLEKAEELGVDRFLCTGDIVGYNAAPKSCLDKIRELQPEIVVKGNHDEYVGSNMSLTGFNPQAAKAVEWTRRQLSEADKGYLENLPYRQRLDRNAEVVHATLDMPHLWGYVFDRFTAASCMQYQFSQVCFVGHTHVPGVFDKAIDIEPINPDSEIELQPGHKYLANVGSVGQPRDGDPRASFVTYSPDEHIIRMYRLEYDVESCQHSVTLAGLPDRLASRLALGR